MIAARPHVILIGGFLGAGKTTAIIALARWLADQGIRAGFITNDQGGDLVDTRLMRSCGLSTEEIAGGCFCCRFDELLGATERLRGVLRPDVFVAEAVGSCTDLAATVTYPMRRIAGNGCTIAPLSVVVDPVRGRQMLGLQQSIQFSPNVRYVYRKQLEEADVIAVSKSDSLPPDELDPLMAALRREFPRAEVFAVSIHAPDSLDAWFRRIVFSEQQPRTVMDLDYDRYADGEARLGWLNASGAATSPVPADGNSLLHHLATELRHRLANAGARIAHLKMTLQAGQSIAAVNLVRDDLVPELGRRLLERIKTGDLLVNLRAEAPPALLEQALRESLHAIGLKPGGWQVELTHVEAFAPGRPVPTHRDVVTQPST